MKYKVLVTAKVKKVIEVEALSEDEARELASENFNAMNDRTNESYSEESEIV